MSKLSFDLINLILSFRPAHPTAVLIKNKKEELLEQHLLHSAYTETKWKIINKKRITIWEPKKGHEETVKLIIKNNYLNQEQYFEEIYHKRWEILQKYESEMFCYCRINDINKVNKFIERFMNKNYYYGGKIIGEALNYYYNESADKRFLNETEENRLKREEQEKREQEDRDEFERELSDEYYREQDDYIHYG